MTDTDDTIDLGSTRISRGEAEKYVADMDRFLTWIPTIRKMNQLPTAERVAIYQRYSAEQQEALQLSMADFQRLSAAAMMSEGQDSQAVQQVADQPGGAPAPAGSQSPGAAGGGDD